MTTYGLSVIGKDFTTTCAMAAAADQAGLDAVWASEFYFTSATVKLAAMATATERCRIGSSIMYGVGRTPMVLAAEARDLDELSGGRLVLGIGNGTKRMLAEWHGITDTASPALRMEELIPLVRRLLRIHEGPVAHSGRFYSVNLRPNPGTPPPLRTDIPIYAAGVRPRMMEAAGRVADGLVGHPLFGVRYIEEVARPAVDRGIAMAERSADDVSLMSMVICAVSDDVEQARRDAAQQIAFYASVRSYESLLDASGFASEGATIREAFGQGDFATMFGAVTDDMIDALAVTGSADDVRVGLKRHDGVLDHVVLYSPSIGIPTERVEANIRALTEIGARAMAE
jgi:probable F420-dependent oxidoreductase